jgi:hypothetical protein
MRSKNEINAFIIELKNGIIKIRENEHKYIDQEVPLKMIEENQCRIHTLEWVLGQHERYD